MRYDDGFVPNVKTLEVSVEHIPDGYDIVEKIWCKRIIAGRVTYVIISDTGTVLFRTQDTPVRKETKDSVLYIWDNPIEF